MTCTSVMDCFVNIAPQLQDLMMDDAAVTVVDAETYTYLAYIPGETIDHGVRQGDDVPKGTLVLKAIEQDERVTSKVDSKQFGFPYVGVGIPIKDEQSNVAGSISVTKSLEKQEEIHKMSSELSQSVSKITEAIETLSAESQELASTGNELKEYTGDLNASVKETDEILKVVKGVTDQTNLLGLNAAIEAARIGDQGKGFGVVAKEIRKLADNTTKSLKQIEDLINTVKNSETDVQKRVENIEKVVNDQAHEIQAISETVRDVEEMSKKLVDFAKDLN